MKFLASLFLTLIFSTTVFSQAVEFDDAYDLDGDSVADLALFDPASAAFYVRSSSSGTVVTVSIPEVLAGEVPVQGDFNDDGRADYGTYNRVNGRWTVEMSGGGSQSILFGGLGEVPVPADYRASCSSYATFNRTNGRWLIGRCDGSDPVATTFGDIGGIPVPGDYDCDSRADKATFNPRTGIWKIQNSSDDSVETFQCGVSGDIPLTHARSNGCATPSLYRPATSTFFVADGDSGTYNCSDITGTQFGVTGDIPLSLSLFGSRRSEFVVYRPSVDTFFAQSATDDETRTFSLSIPGAFDTPVVVPGNRLVFDDVKGDYNRDGKADIGLVTVDTSTLQTIWVADLGDGTSQLRTLNAAADAIVPGDYDGDGTENPAIVSVNTTTGFLEWRFTNAFGQQAPTVVWGQNTGQPLSGDLDCDGKDDYIVSYATGVGGSGTLRTFEALLSVGSLFTGKEFGFGTDRPIVGDFDGDGCDEIGVVRDQAGFKFWFYQELTDDEFTATVVQWGLASDTELKPTDANGDGADDFTVARNIGGFKYFFSRLDRGFSVVPATPLFTAQFGVEADSAYTGDFSGSGFAEFSVLRSLSDGINRFIRSFTGQTLQGLLAPGATQIVGPDRQVFNISTDTGGGGSGGGGTGECVRTGGPTDFIDGGNGDVWKPESDISSGPRARKVVFLVDNSYCGRSNFRILGANGDEVSRVIFEKCNCNGRTCYWLEDFCEELEPFDPITVEIDRGDRVECRVVEDACTRND